MALIKVLLRVWQANIITSATATKTGLIFCRMTRLTSGKVKGIKDLDTAVRARGATASQAAVVASSR